MTTTTWKKLASDRVMLLAGIGVLLGLVFVSRSVLIQGLDMMRKGHAAYTHIHCPTCGDEFTYRPGLERQPCPSCESKEGMIRTVGPMAEASGWGRLVALGVFAAVLLLGLAYVGAWRLRVIGQHEDEILHRLLSCHCPFCKRKLGYTLQRAGAAVKCPRCKTSFVLPPEPGDGVATPT